jgi:hypothetical protein|tara:strand:+ start:302 stop:466 length:165 start_codon:yes stop_codon:yes gene_type:complete
LLHKKYLGAATRPPLQQCYGNGVFTNNASVLAVVFLEGAELCEKITEDERLKSV